MWEVRLNCSKSLIEFDNIVINENCIHIDLPLELLNVVLKRRLNTVFRNSYERRFESFKTWPVGLRRPR